MKLLREIYLTNTTPGHDKFYRVRVFEMTTAELAQRGEPTDFLYHVVAGWGRIDTAGTEMTKVKALTASAAENQALTLTAEKRTRGYKTVHDLTAEKIEAKISKTTKGSKQPTALPPIPQSTRFSDLEL